MLSTPICSMAAMSSTLRVTSSAKAIVRRAEKLCCCTDHADVCEYRWMAAISSRVSGSCRCALMASWMMASAAPSDEQKALEMFGMDGERVVMSGTSAAHRLSDMSASCSLIRNQDGFSDSGGDVNGGGGGGGGGGGCVACAGGAASETSDC